MKLFRYPQSGLQFTGRVKAGRSDLEGGLILLVPWWENLFMAISNGQTASGFEWGDVFCVFSRMILNAGFRSYQR